MVGQLRMLRRIDLPQPGAEHRNRSPTRIERGAMRRTVDPARQSGQHGHARLREASSEICRHGEALVARLAGANDCNGSRIHVLHQRAPVEQERGQVEEAVKSLQRALYLDQDFALAHFALGNLCKQQGKFTESDRHFKNALSLLRRFKNDEILPESEGMTAGRLSEIITSIKGKVMLV
jgi:tetratricopeptide (TPR) repeat protein